MPEHRCQHLFEPGWTPPDPSDDEPCGVAAAAVLIGVAAVVIALVIATAVVAVAWALIGGAGGLAMVATARPPVHHCAYCGDEIRTTCGIVIRQGQIWCCDPCYYTAHPEAARAGGLS
jgi:hypothetical protein